VALMGQNQIGDISAGLWKTTNPQFTNDLDLFPGIPCKWGLGYMMGVSVLYKKENRPPHAGKSSKSAILGPTPGYPTGKNRPVLAFHAANCGFSGI
jgi:hypothetical protein